MDITSTLTLNNGVTIPRLGLGVFRSGASTKDAVLRALEVGYRHVDTAHIYRNEEGVGQALRESEVAREDVFVTTKLWNDDHGYDAALRAFDASVAALGVETIDLWLIHWPVPEKRLESWRAMERVLKEGRVRAIGVSNFMVHHLEELRANSEVVPAINQIEIHPFGQQAKVTAWCKEKGIAVQAYSPLTKAKRLDDPALGRVANAVGRTPAQVLIRWALQHDLIVLPKSADPGRIAENAAVFDFALDVPQMEELDGLEEDLHTAWDPTTEP